MKEIIHYTTAIALLLAGIILAFLGFYMPPEGEIHDSVLWLFAQCLIYTGSVFGLQLYVRQKISEQLFRKNYETNNNPNPPADPPPLLLPYMPDSGNGEQARK